MPRYRLNYIALRLARRLMPERVAHRFLSKRHFEVERLYRTTTSTYWRALRETDAGKALAADTPLTLMEAGTGVYNPASAPLLLGGNHRLILLEPYLGKNLDEARLRERLEGLLRAAESDPEFPVAKRRTAAQIMALPRANHGLPQGCEFLDRLWEDTGLPNASVDLLLSASVFEHLRNPAAVIAESGRIVRPGGWMIHTVDMRDHYFRYPLEMLKYSPGQWAALTTQEGGSGYQNRLRLNQWLELLDKNSFVTECLPVEMLDEHLARERPFLHPDFAKLDDATLRVGICILVSRRR